MAKRGRPAKPAKSRQELKAGKIKKTTQEKRVQQSRPWWSVGHGIMMEMGDYDELQLLQISYDSAVIDPRELVRCSGHVDIVVLVLLPFTVKEQEYRIVSGRVLNKGRHDLEKRLG